MTIVTIISFLFFTGLVGFLTWRLTSNDDHQSSTGYFLGGRSLTFPLIAGSLLLTNLSTEQMVGLNGDAFKDGLSVMVWEVVSVISLVMMAWFFLPRFLKSGVSTVPEYLAIRYDKRTQLIGNIIFLLAYVVVLLPIILYTGAKGMIGILDLNGAFGIQAADSGPDYLLWGIVVVVGAFGSIYALFGGLKTVAVSDTLNGIGLLVGGLLVSFFALSALGGDAGVVGGIDRLRDEQASRLNSIGGKDALVPFGTVFSGVFLLTLFYWTTNQQIIQRTLGASSLAEGQKGVLLTGLLKLLGPLYLVLPGMIAFSMFGQEIAPVDAYGRLVQKVLPSYLTGFFAAALLGAILSSFNSALNSACTLFSLGTYRSLFNPQASDEDLIRIGKYFGWVIAIAAMIIAPLLDGQESIFSYLQAMNAIYFIPLLAVVLVGMLTRRTPALAAQLAMVGGVLILILGNFVWPFKDVAASMDGHFFAGTVFSWLVIGMLVIGEIRPRKEAFIQEDVGAVDMKPWRLNIPAGICLIFLVFAIYAFFADFSVLSETDTQNVEPQNSAAEVSSTNVPSVTPED